MKRSKIIYLFNALLIILTFIYIKNYKYESIYHDETLLTGIIEEIKVNDQSVNLVIKADEKILTTCYNCEINFKVGDKVKINGYFKEINSLNNFNLFNYQKYLMSKKIFKNFIFNKIEYIETSNNLIYKAYNILNDQIGSLKSSSFIKSLVLGDTTSLEDDIYDDFKTNGIIHLFAVSGMHVNILASFIALIMKKLLKRQCIAYIITVPLLVFYMLIINSASIIRSVLIYIACILKNLLHLKISTTNILLYVCIINLVVNPYNIYNLGFTLSYIVSFGLLITTKKIETCKNYFSKLFMTSFISFLVSIPLIVNTNYEINLLTPIINVFIIPLVTTILFPLSILTLIFPILDFMLFFLINGFNYLNQILASVSIIINIPYMNTITVIIFYSLFLISINNYKYLFLIVFLLIILNNKQYFVSIPYLTMIDVGQGDSILISYPYNKMHVLVDAGGNKNIGKTTIVPYLKSVGITKINHLIITHGDSDHTAGALDLTNEINIENIYFNSFNNTDIEEEIMNIKPDYKLIEDEYNINNNIKIYTFRNSNENNDSLITYFNDYKILLMGDATDLEEAKLPAMDVKILKVGHHGSATSTSEEFVTKMNPVISLISVGKNNRYKHPSLSVLDILSKTKILKTSELGMIKINLQNLEYETVLWVR